MAGPDPLLTVNAAQPKGCFGADASRDTRGPLQHVQWIPHSQQLRKCLLKTPRGEASLANTAVLRHLQRQNLSIEEQQRIGGLVLSRSRDLAVYRQVAQKCFDFDPAELARMALFME